MKKIIPFLKPYRAQLLLAVLLSAASTLCELLLPTIMSDILDKGVYLADLSYILRCCGRMLIVALISLVRCWAARTSAHRSSRASVPICARQCSTRQQYELRGVQFHWHLRAPQPRDA